jgi:hypothetical protein
LPTDHRVRAEFGGRQGQEPPRLPKAVQQRYEREGLDIHVEQDRQRSRGFTSPPGTPPDTTCRSS